jgi:murein DD-endopeptidase MepM/ murein hydrolase activator NlpD
MDFVSRVPRPGALDAGGRPADLTGPAAEPTAADREKLKRIAAEFESMLLVQVLKDMRQTGSWDEGESGTQFESLFETLDVELATHLSRVKGLGLSNQLEEAFDRLAPGAGQIPNPKPQNPSPKPEIPSLTPHVTTARIHGNDPHDSHNPIVEAVKTAAEVTVAAPKAVAHFLKPVAGAVTSAFGWRQDPFTQETKFHKGVDLKAAYGQEVQAAAAGRVVFSGERGGYGTTVEVEHPDGTRTRYAHLSARSVAVGDEIEAGASLGRAGRSGRATGTHVHFEVIAADGRRVAPRLTDSRHE